MFHSSGTNEGLTDRGPSSVAGFEAFVAIEDRRYGHQPCGLLNKINGRFNVKNSHRLRMPLSQPVWLR